MALLIDPLGEIVSDTDTNLRKFTRAVRHLQERPKLPIAQQVSLQSFAVWSDMTRAYNSHERPTDITTQFLQSSWGSVQPLSRLYEEEANPSNQKYLSTVLENTRRRIYLAGCALQGGGELLRTETNRIYSLSGSR